MTVRNTLILSRVSDIGSKFVSSGCRKFEPPAPDPLVLGLVGGSTDDYEKIMDKVGTKLAMIDVLLQEL